MISDKRRAQIGRRQLEAHILERESAHVAGEQRVGGRDADGVVFTRDFRDTADGGLLGGAAAWKRHVNVVEADVLQKSFIETVEGDAGEDLARVVIAGEASIAKLHGFYDGGVDAVEGDVADDARWLCSNGRLVWR